MVRCTAAWCKCPTGSEAASNIVQVLLAPNPQMLQQKMDHLHQFCLEMAVEVNVSMTEVWSFSGHPEFPDGGREWQYKYGQPITRAKTITYLGVILHETEGFSIAVTSLATAARHATWAMTSRFQACKVRDIPLKLRMYKALVFLQCWCLGASGGMLVSLAGKIARSFIPISKRFR